MSRGHLAQRSPGSWRVVVSAGRDPATGRRRQVTRTVKGPKRLAEQELTRLMREVDQGILADAGHLTVGEYLEQKFLPHIGTRVRPRTVARYRSLLQLHVMPVIGGLALARLRPVHIQRVLDSALDRGLAKRTVLHLHRVLHSALAQAVRWQLLNSNPSSAIRPPRPERPNLSVPDATAVAVLLRAAEGSRWYVPIALAATTGMRRGEVLGLRWSALDLDAGLVRVTTSAQVVGRKVEFVEPKTGRSRRTVALPSATVSLLRRHRASQAVRRLLAGSDWLDHDLVVERGDGGPVHPDLFSQAFERLSAKLGLHARLHDLRHAYACMLLEANVHPKVASEALGHSSVAFTMDTYSHVLPTMQGDAAKAVQSALGEVLEGAS